jgi:hypothetical protein
LIHTLIERLAFHECGGVAFHALRRWRAEIKAYQIEGLFALKRNPSAAIVDKISAELETATKKIVGTGAIRNVVPIPPGSSGNPNNLSVQVARSLAGRLKADFADILISGSCVASTRSHPKKAAGLRPYTIQKPLCGLTLLVDDVATSGRHMELGLKALRATGVPALGLVWIGR